MKIAEIAPAWFTVPPQEYGGIELMVATLSEGLVARGHDVTLFASGGSRTKGRLISPLAEPPGLPGNPWLEVFHAASAYRRAREFDVIHDHTAVGPAIGAMENTPPIVHTLHGSWDDATRRRYVSIDDRVHLVAISKTQRDAHPTLQYAGLVHHGIDLNAYPLREDKDDFVLFVGRSCPDKGPDRAVEVARRAGVPLVMVVKRQEDFEKDYWRTTVEPLLTGNERIYEGINHEQKVDLMGRARALLFPIDWAEPFGLVMVEAMACGTPVLATPMGAATEVVADGRTGFLTATIDDMADSLDRVGQISPAGCRAHVGLRFSAEAMVRGYERVFQLAIRRTRGRKAMRAGA